MSIKFKNTITPTLKILNKLHKNTTDIALKRAGIALAVRCNTEAPKPPIDTGHLRRSLVVFLENSKVYGLGDEEVSVNSYSKPNTITIGYNTDYAKRVHNQKVKWGERSRQDGGVGTRWLTIHLYTDASFFMKTLSYELQKAERNSK